MVIDTNGFDLGLETLETGTDARVFLGSTDPAKAILLQSSTNTMDQVISGVTIDLNRGVSDSVLPRMIGEILEDARIERRLIDRFRGARRYLAAHAAEALDAAQGPVTYGSVVSMVAEGGR